MARTDTSIYQDEVIIFYVPVDEEEFTPDKVYDVQTEKGTFTWRRGGQNTPVGARELLRFDTSTDGVSDYRQVAKDKPQLVTKLDGVIASWSDDQKPATEQDGRTLYHPLGLAYYIIEKIAMQIHGKMEWYGNNWGYVTSFNQTIVP